MPFQYKTVLMIGATSGIGLAMSERLVQEGAKVVVVGRREENLNAFVSKHGKDRAGAIKFDISNSAGIDHFINEATTKHPDIDCVFLNAGTQHPVNLTEPSSESLAKFHAEINVNFTCIVDLSLKFLPFLKAKKEPTSLIFTGTHLALVPAMTLTAYSASKAALNSFVMSLRAQLHASTVKVIDIWPPLVQTELHDYAGPKGRTMGMPVDKFVEAAYQGLAAGKELVAIGAVGPPGMVSEAYFGKMIQEREAVFEQLSHAMRGEKWESVG